MTHSTLAALLLATPALAALLEDLLPDLAACATSLEDFRSQPITPEATYDLEQRLLQCSRALARRLLQGQLNRLEPEDTPQVPSHLYQDGNRYRRRAKHRVLPARVQNLIRQCRAERRIGSWWGRRTGGRWGMLCGGSRGRKQCSSGRATVPWWPGHGSAAIEGAPGR